MQIELHIQDLFLSVSGILASHNFIFTWYTPSVCDIYLSNRFFIMNQKCYLIIYVAERKYFQ